MPAMHLFSLCYVEQIKRSFPIHIANIADASLLYQDNLAHISRDAGSESIELPLLYRFEKLVRFVKHKLYMICRR